MQTRLLKACATNVTRWIGFIISVGSLSLSLSERQIERQTERALSLSLQLFVDHRSLRFRSTRILRADPHDCRAASGQRCSDDYRPPAAPLTARTTVSYCPSNSPFHCIILSL